MSAIMPLPVLASSGGALIASPSSSFREQLVHRLNGRCRPVQQVLGGADALAKLEKGNWQVLFLDRRLPDLDTEELIAIIGRRFPGIQVVLLDSDGAQTDAAQAADDEIRGNVSNDTRGMQPPIRDAHSSVASEPLPGMIGTSEAMRRVYRMVRL